jgi:hypothetical protein
MAPARQIVFPNAGTQADRMLQAFIDNKGKMTTKQLMKLGIASHTKILQILRSMGYEFDKTYKSVKVSWSKNPQLHVTYRLIGA